MSGSDALQRVEAQNIFLRGMSFSQYQHAYTEYIAEGGWEDGGRGSRGENSAKRHVYTTAIRRLQISVVPDNLPCREAEREFVLSNLRKAVVERSTSKPIYISGWMGTGARRTFFF